MMAKEQIEGLVRSVPFWFHSIDLGQGVVTPGIKTAEWLQRELTNLRLPILRGRSVLDINTWDGFYAFKAEELGAASVTALDFYMWAMDLGQHFQYWTQCKQQGVCPKRFETMPYYKPKELPGKAGFDVVQLVLKSRVKQVVGDFMHIDVDTLGQFDVVLYLGSLYHMENGFESLKRLARVTRELAVIETQASELPGFRSEAFVQFFEAGELNGDPSNWWAPNLRALGAMSRAAGFKRVEVIQGPPYLARFALFSLLKNAIRLKKFSRVWDYRAIVHAWK
jgi:tRNA (mo5U34)-methyltransferase